MSESRKPLVRGSDHVFPTAAGVSNSLPLDGLELLTQLTERIQEVFWVADPNIDQTFFVSPGYERVWGRARQDLYANPRSFVDAVHPDDRDRVLATLAQQREGIRFEHEYRIIRPDGEVRWIWDRGEPILDREDRPVRYVGVALDITTLKVAAERATLQAEVLDRVEQAVIVTDLGGRIKYWNPWAERMYGWTAAEMVDKQTVGLLLAPGTEPDAAVIMTELSAGRSWSGEFRLRRRDGTEFWGLVTDTPLRDDAGALVGIVGVSSDITVRREAEEALRHAGAALERRVAERTAEIERVRHRLELATKATGLGTWELDPETGQFIWDEQTCRIHGRDGGPREVPRSEARMLVHPDDRTTLTQATDDALARGGFYAVTYRIIRPDGSIRHLRAGAILIESPEFPGPRLVGALQDVTEEAVAALRARESEDAIRAANRELESAIRTKDEFLSSMSHELRTPLSGILGLAEALDDGVYGALNPAQRAPLRLLTESGLHLLDLINDILDLSKIEAGKLEVSAEPVDAEAVGAASLRILRQAAAGRDVRLHFSTDGGADLVAADSRRLKQILLNLIGNGIKFTPPGGQVGLDLTRDRTRGVARLEVWDTGIGIPAEKIPQLFQPFSQLETGLARGHGGTGLGLALVRRLTHMLGGTVSVVSTVGSGSRFTVEVPLWRPDAEQSASEPGPLSGPHDPAGVAAKRLILIADDNDTNRDLVRDLLVARGYPVVSATNGVDALERATALHPALILMDLQMPTMDGLETIRRIRANPELAGTVIVALTAMAMPADRQRCLEAGANDYLAKPFSLRKLLDLVELTAGRVPSA